MECRQALKEFFLLVSLLKKNNGTETYTYLRNHISPYLCSKIMKSIDSGIVSTVVNLMEQACGTQFITKLVDALRRNEKIYFLGGSVLTLLAILLAYSDLFKDIAVSCTILEAIGGIKALYNYPYQFGSAVVLVSFGATFIPWILANVELVLSFSDELFFKCKKSNGILMNLTIPMINVFIFLFSPLILIHHQQSMRQKLMIAAKEGQLNETMNYIKKLNRVTVHKSRHLQMELGMENFNQVTILLILLLLARTYTPLTGGLSTMFSNPS